MELTQSTGGLQSPPVLVAKARVGVGDAIFKGLSTTAALVLPLTLRRWRFPSPV